MRIYERLRQHFCRHAMGEERLAAEPASGGVFAWRMSRRCKKCGAESWREAQPHEVPPRRMTGGPRLVKGLVRIAE